MAKKATRRRLIENGFPFEEISELAQVESWRKEIYRPRYHLHKWWAKRLGSVFRATILASLLPDDHDLMEEFYGAPPLAGTTVLDPFMGSGTTIGEALKLGCAAVGRDINPVAFRGVQTSLAPLDRRKLTALFRQLDNDIGGSIRSLYETKDRDGNAATALYFFWVKVLPCPGCDASVDLFSRYIFAQHASAKKHPLVRIVCPGCGDVFSGDKNDESPSCPSCQLTFDPHSGPAQRTKARCGECGTEFPIAKTAKGQGRPPEHRLFAKMVLTSANTKQYLRANDADLAAFAKATQDLAAEQPELPTVEIAHGHNTKQVMNYGYTRWAEFFNARQLLALSRIAKGINRLEDCPERTALATLLSGTLEFNNMFASFKGEGTGAVRHMFSHHILKPERAPLEANVWGTPKSSGSFSTLFKSRLLRALEYDEHPFEVGVVVGGKKLKGEKIPIEVAPTGRTLRRYPRNGAKPGDVFLSCGSSSELPLPDACIDAVITDPPFFDNVHYSELADFFHVWQELWFPWMSLGTESTRQKDEVQDTDAERFSLKLEAVFRECQRVLKDDGLLVFSYHHSRDDGWSSVASAVANAGFTFVQSQPVKAEMAVATPKAQAKEPIDIDVLLVCRPSQSVAQRKLSAAKALTIATKHAGEQVARFSRAGRRLSRNDVRVVATSQLLCALSPGRNASELEGDLVALRDELATLVGSLHQEAAGLLASPRGERPLPQLSLI